MATNDAWLNTVQEAPLEPDLPICDPHHHLWVNRPEWVQPDYLLTDVLADVNSGHNVVSTVFIECHSMYSADVDEAMAPVGETEFVNGIAAMSASGLFGKTRIAAGIVGSADLRLGTKVGAVLDAHLAAGGGRFRGIRHIAAFHESPEFPRHWMNPPPHLFLDTGFRQGFAELAKRKLSFEAWCFHPQLPDLIQLAKAFPDTAIILNHFGGPLGIGTYAGKADEVFPEWKASISELAKCQNVVAKLGGLNMVLNGFGWQDQPQPPSSQTLMEATRRYYEHTIEAFGVERCMFESNFPVDKVTCSYPVLWNAFKRLVADYTPAEKAKLFHDTAVRVYRL